MAPRKGQRVSPATEIKHGERRSPATEFQTGVPTAYRHPPGFRAAPATEFQLGHTPANFKGVGTPRRLLSGELVTTLADVTLRTSRGRRYLGKKRTSYARYLWTEQYGPIPAGLVVYNNRPGEIPVLADLELITRAELARRNRQAAG